MPYRNEFRSEQWRTRYTARRNQQRDDECRTAGVRENEKGQERERERGRGREGKGGGEEDGTIVEICMNRSRLFGRGMSTPPQEK